MTQFASNSHTELSVYIFKLVKTMQSLVSSRGMLVKSESTSQEPKGNADLLSKLKLFFNCALVFS